MLHLDPANAAADAVSIEPSAADQRQAARGRAEQQMVVLDRLVEIGMEIAEEAGRQARAPADERSLHDPALAYSRAARAVRLTIALQQRLSKDLAALGREEASVRRKRIHRAVERVIEAECEDEDEIEQLSDEARERLWEGEALDELAGLPLAEAVALICKELGLSPEGWVGAFGADEPKGASPDHSETLLSRWRMGERPGAGVRPATPDVMAQEAATPLEIPP